MGSRMGKKFELWWQGQKEERLRDGVSKRSSRMASSSRERAGATIVWAVLQNGIKKRSRLSDAQGHLQSTAKARARHYSGTS